MKFVEVDINEIGVSYRWGNCMTLIEAFAESGLQCAEITGYSCQSPYTCRTSLNNAAKRCNKPHIRSFVKNGKVYIMNELFQ